MSVNGLLGQFYLLPAMCVSSSISAWKGDDSTGVDPDSYELIHCLLCAWSFRFHGRIREPSLTKNYTAIALNAMT